MATSLEDSKSFTADLTSSEGPSNVPDSPSVSEKPRRNLTEAFEALCINAAASAPDESNTKAEEGVEALFSPTSVASSLQPESKSALAPYQFTLHQDLSRGLSPALIGRVSLYSVIHDINKEASAMAANDPKDDHKEDDSPLVQAVNGASPVQQGSDVASAMIDEETWLLDAIHSRSRDEGSEARACPPTFLQAMGEKEYENPVHALSGASRTQLWKPSRSWWEAKSGKNPWIEPNSHNKRWRYLWPFIHYHKFLAKCIKKLKRNGADVKHSVSPVAVFLREEVCAVSDHLASVSLFGSDEWMDCLQHFSGWTDDKAEASLLAHVRQLKLRPLHEPGDVDSPLLRSQIDEHFLRAMAAQRDQLRDVPNSGETSKKSKNNGHPPIYPRSAGSVNAVTTPGSSPPPLAPNSAHRRPRHPHQHQQYWNNHGKPPVVYGDSASVQSGISTESGFNHSYHEYVPPMGQYPSYYPGHLYGSSGASNYVDPYHTMNQTLHHHHHPGWYDPGLASYGVHPPAYFPESHGHQVPESPEELEPSQTEKEEKEDHTSETTPHHIATASPQHYGHSPFWSHLVDGATQSLATPAKVTPSTPVRSIHDSCDHSDLDESFGHDNAEAGTGAQPLLLRGYHSYGYGHHYGSSDAYVPPSPATQFMMPPTQNNSFYYGYTAPSANFSPGRHPHVRVSPQKADFPTPVRKVVEVVEAPSPTTVETCTETTAALSNEAISA